MLTDKLGSTTMRPPIFGVYKAITCQLFRLQLRPAHFPGARAGRNKSLLLRSRKGNYAQKSNTVRIASWRPDNNLVSRVIMFFNQWVVPGKNSVVQEFLPQK